MSLKLFLIRQRVNKRWDTYDSAVVAASSSDEASKMYPGSPNGVPNGHEIDYDHVEQKWVSDPKDVYVEYIGEAADDIIQSVICASFNAG